MNDQPFISPELQEHWPTAFESLDFSFDPSFLEVEPQYVHDPTLGGLRTPTGSSILEEDAVVAEDGRTYHGYSQGSMYFLPNDGEEQDRLDLQHHLSMLVFDGKLALAPIDKPKHVLDVATGTGIWAIEFAEKYPASHVVGTDLSIIQPVPRVPNCEFLREDSERQEWIYPYTFDYIHMRAVISCFDDFQVVLKKSFDNMSPGGWLEVQDFDMHCYSMDGTSKGTALEKIFLTVADAMKKLGRSSDRLYRYKDWFAEAGFTDVVERFIPMPMGGWAKDPRQKLVGKYAQLDGMSLLPGLRRLLLLAGISEAAADNLVARSKQDLGNPKMHAIFNIVVVYGRKSIKEEAGSVNEGESLEF